MDKNKSRTDLLAAGRKKLQQYRQKKDSKGSVSHGKSMKKSGKLEHHEADADVESTPDKPTSVSLVPEGEIAPHVDSDSSVMASSTSHSTGNIDSGSEVDVAVGDPSAVSSTLESSVVETLTAHNELSSPMMGVGEHGVDSLVQTEGTSTGTEVARGVLVTVESLNVDSEDSSLPLQADIVDSGPESLLSQDGSPDTSLMQAREDQVTDVGAMQEADGLDGRQFNHNSEIELEGDGKFLLYEVGRSAEALSGIPLAETSVNTSCEAEKTGKVDEVSISDGGSILDEFSGVALAISKVEISHISPAVADQQSTGAMLGSFLEEKPGVPLKTDDFRKGSTDRVQDDTGDRRVVQGYNQQHIPDSCVKPTETDLASSARGWIVSSGSDLSSISLSQLIDLIRGLSEEEYGLLFKSLGPISSAEFGSDNLKVPDLGFPNLLERLKEELYLTNFTKDIFQLQLAQHCELQGEFDNQRHQLIDELSLLSASFKEASEKNQFLGEELSQCKSELQAAVSAREELQNQFCTSKAEVEGLSARVYELQISLERSQEDLLGLSTELADCKELVASLKVENESLNGTLALVTEDRKKLSKEKDFYFEENEKLITELADCKRLVAALQQESSNLTTNLSLVAAERKMLEEEKEHSCREHEKTLMEFADCKGVASALELEHSNLKKSLALLTEERKRFEDDKKYFALENERLLSELLSLQKQLSSEQRERERVTVDLKEVTMHLEQLTEENIFLSSSLDIHKAKIIEAASSRPEIPVQSREDWHQVEFSEVRSRDCEHVIAGEDSYCILGKQVDEVCSSFFPKPLSDYNAGRTPHMLLEHGVFDDSLGFVALNGHLEEVGRILHQLEKAIEGVQTYSAAFNKPGGKVAAPGVSKLIQAFESKVHLDEQEAEERPPTENKSTAADPFVLMEEEIKNLKASFKQLVLDAADACVMFKDECDGRRTCDSNVTELKDQCQALKDHSNSLEATNIELAVLCEVLKQHGGNIEATNNELVLLCEATRQEVTDLKSENSELGSKLHAYELRIGDLESQFYDLQRTSNETAAVIGNHLGDLQKEFFERILILEEDWKSTLAQIVEIVQKLGGSVGNISSTVLVPDNGLDVVSRVAASVNATTTLIEDMQLKLEASQTDHEVISMSYKEVNERCNDLHQKNDLAVGLLHKIHAHLRKLMRLHGSVDEGEMSMETEMLPHPLDYSIYETFMGRLEHFLSERLELESVVEKLNLELVNRRGEFEELNRGCLDANVICKLIEDVEGVLTEQDSELYVDKSPASRFESLVCILVQKYREAHLTGSKVVKFTELQEEIQQLIGFCVQHEIEIFVLKESLSQVEEALFATGSELQRKVSELEQCEQRVSSVREKLSIAVAKGKGLVVQRDGLKQSLAETSSELERSLQDLQLKDARLHEVETKLKTYSEAGERVEALESELLYIRNSATALRESFLLKDSVLQRIEEILEDLDLPEHFHARDVIEKVDWLARSVTGNVFLPSTDWDQKSSAGGGTFSDAGFVMTEPWKDDLQSSSNSAEDLKRKFEELQSRFYGLAEQNEMLEQSLMERNNLVQKWEDLLDRIDMPSHLRSVEPEDRIQWLGRALSEAHQDTMSFQQKVVNFENYCGSLNADLEDSQRSISDLVSNLEAITQERENLLERLKLLNHDYEEFSAKAGHYEVENRRLQSEVTSFQENQEKLSARVDEVEFENRKLQNEVADFRKKVAEMLGNEERILSIEGEIRRLQSLVNDVLQDPGIEDQVSSGSSIECLELLLRKLLENYVNFSTVKSVRGGVIDGLQNDVVITEAAKSISKPDVGESDIAILKKELEEALHELIRVKEERDGYFEKQQSLACEIEALVKEREELVLLLNQEEQKSASVREKLNVAVRKGKSLVQQRDSLKQTIEEMNAVVQNIKSESKIQENKHVDYEKKLEELSTYPERVEVLESEILLLRNHLTENEQHLQETGHVLSRILNTLADIDVGDGVSAADPVKKLEKIVKLCCDLRADMASSEEESRKSRRAAELLLAELNEVQERNDSLQEELANAAAELSDLTKERDVAEGAKLEALSRLEKLYNVHSLEQRNQFSELKGLKSGVEQVRKGFHDVSNLLADVCSKDLEFLHNLESSIGNFLKPSNASDVASMPRISASAGLVSNSSDRKELYPSKDLWSGSIMHDSFEGSFVTEVCSSVEHQLEELMIEVGVLKEKLQRHSSSLDEKASNLSKLVAIAHRETISRNELYEAIKNDIIRKESSEMEKDKELVMLHKSIALSFEAFSNTVMEIEQTKAELLGNNFAAGVQGINLNSATFPSGGLSFSRQGQVSEESIKTMADKLLFAVRDFASVKAEIVEGSQKQLKIAIADLQKELQEKEIQKDRICMDLVSQIKEAEAAATRYSLELQSSRSQVDEMEKQLEVMERERNLLEQKVKELQNVHVTSTELQERVGSLSHVIAAKDQEIEALMQALDEEELQMEDLKKKMEELEKVLQQKNLDLENVEVSRGKVMKKLSTTVTKFDELHQLSASLLTEVEKLQSQLQDRDAEISFLRQEVTRCTNDVLVASQLSNKRDSDDIHEFLTWFDIMIANVGMQNVHPDVKNNDQVHEHKELLKKKLESLISELTDLREVAQCKDTLLQVERSKVDDMTRKGEILERSLRDKESRLSFLEGVGTSGVADPATSEILEVEPLINKWTVPGTSAATQVRSLRKGNNDQIAIAIDMDPGSGNRLEDEDDDKVHGFKSLTTSRIVPRFTRPVTDMIDGLWVSCDRALMRQPALRLGIIIYWAILHALLATFAI
ncbi:nucleoporin [Parasponia andersonii]|uniref:Nucleoporin n=1 Tax=Parasponia andersonii TaxID=3476 RepID=A0A2P5DIG0_PARAD|nr:nucleoporin [Parasponia andersonii]